MLTPEYVAGFFDGEGCVYVDNTKEKVYVLKITLAQNTKLILEKIKEIYGGNIYTRQPTSTKQYEVYQWTASGQEAFNFILSIIPHSIVKQQELLRAIQFPLKIIGVNPSPEIIEQRKNIREDLQKFKKLYKIQPNL